MYRVCGYQLGKDKLQPSTSFPTYKEAATFQDNLHRMFAGMQVITHIEAYNKEHIGNRWAQVSNTVRG